MTLMNLQGNEVVELVVSSIVEEQSILLDGGKAELEIEAMPLLQTLEGQEGVAPKGAGSQLTGGRVWRRLGAGIVAKAGQTTLASLRGTRTQLTHSGITIQAGIRRWADAGIATFAPHTGSSILAGIRVAEIHLRVAQVVLLAARESLRTGAGERVHRIDGSEEHRIAVDELGGIAEL